MTVGAGCAKFSTTASGKSLRIIRISVKPQNKKYFAFRVGQISGIWFAVSRPQEGRFAIVTDVGRGMRWTFLASGDFSPDESAKTYGEVVWSWRRDAGVKPLRNNLRRGDGDNKPAHRGEHEISRKAVARGKPECLAEPVVTISYAFFICMRGCGCGRHPAFPAPSVWRGQCRYRLGRVHAARSRNCVCQAQMRHTLPGHAQPALAVLPPPVL